MAERLHKHCGECDSTKPLEDFHRNRGKKDGRSTQCKECAKTRAKTWYHENADRHLEGHRAWRRANPGKEKAFRQKAERKDRQKVRARVNFHYALRVGWIKKPDACEKCGSKLEVSSELHGHHPDYSKPYDVEWLCRQCHQSTHNELVAA